MVDNIKKAKMDFAGDKNHECSPLQVGRPVRASFPKCVRPFLEDGNNEVWYR